MNQIKLVHFNNSRNPNNLVLKRINAFTNNIPGQPFKNVQANYALINTSTTPILITSILPVYPSILNVTPNITCNFPIVLSKDQKIKINLSGMFILNFKLEYPIKIVAFIDNIPMEYVFQIEIDLATEENTFASTSAQIVNNNVTIILGIPIETFYGCVNKFSLKRYNIPENIKSLLDEVIKKHPEFISRYRNQRSIDYANVAKTFKIETRLNEKNYAQMLHVLLYIEENQMIHDIKEYKTTSTFEYLPEMKIGKNKGFHRLKVPGLAEARPSLIRGDSVYASGLENPNYKYQGIVHKTEELSVVLGFHPSIGNIKNKKYLIEFDFNRRCIKVEHQAVDLVKNHEVVSYFFPKKVCHKQIAKQKDLNFFDRKLNDEQKRAVKNIVGSKPNFAPYLIFGPPGTGKTVTVVEAVLQTWKFEENCKILICAPSNAAVNELAFRLVNKIPKSQLFRVLGNTYGNDVTQQETLKPICNIENGAVYMPSLDKLSQYRILLITTITAARLVNGGVPPKHFTHVFIDEGGYATETETLVPIVGILTSQLASGVICGKVVLAGDPRQLGPRIHSEFVNYCGFGKSMLERLLDTCDVYKRNEAVKNKSPYDEKYVTKLVVNYRSHPSILHVPNELFYNNELIAGGGDNSYLFENWEYLKAQKFPVIFDHVEGEDKKEKDSPSFFNEQEVKTVLNYVEKLINSRVKGRKINKADIGIISPYRKQVEKINEELLKRNYKQILAGSTEQFQGREKLIIILSTVRSKNNQKFKIVDNIHDLGFVKNPKRLNVALTRAKALLIVIGNGHILRTDHSWNKFIEYCHENKSINGKFKFDSNDFKEKNGGDSGEEINPDAVDFSRGCE